MSVNYCAECNSPIPIDWKYCTLCEDVDHPTTIKKEVRVTREIRPEKNKFKKSKTGLQRKEI